MWEAIEEQIQQAVGQPFQVEHCQAIGGGSINQAYRVEGEGQVYFIKVNQVHRVEMFEAEAVGLQALAATQQIGIPKVIGWGTGGTQSYLVLEWLDLHSRGDWSALGQQLAQMHRHTSPEGFGWHRHNTIGDTPQPNPWTRDWAEFFARSRIGHQLQLARHRGEVFAQGDSILKIIPQVLTHQLQPSLVHGDLWSGNAGFKRTGEPVLFDPAVYFGDREVDVAMTELFGGFPAAFYQGYQAVWPLAPGYEQRKPIYNLYHILNHFNLFGGHYRTQAAHLMQHIVGA